MNRHAETPTIVVCVEDESALYGLCDHLAADRFRPIPASSASDALRLCRYNLPDLLVLDLAVADIPGDDVLGMIREAGTDASLDPDLPIIVLADRAGAPDQARGLEGSADDYLQRPFRYDELRARIAAVLRRRHGRDEDPVRVGEMVIDPARHRVTVGKKEVHLSRKEFALLLVLASDPTRVFSEEELRHEVWGLGVSSRRSRIVHSNASRLRRKLDPEHRRYVINCWGIGYRLIEAPAIGGDR